MQTDKRFRLPNADYQIEIQAEQNAATLYDDQGKLRKSSLVRLKILTKPPKKTWVDYFNRLFGPYLTIR